MATGGIDSAATAFDFIKNGASLIQVASAVQNQDFTVINDYITGLRALLYLDQVTTKWRNQSTPTTVHQKGKPVTSFFNEDTNCKLKMPFFGPYMQFRDENDKNNETEDFQWTPRIVSKWMKLNDYVGVAVKNVNSYKQLNNRKQVVAVINDVS